LLESLADHFAAIDQAFAALNEISALGPPQPTDLDEMFPAGTKPGPKGRREFLSDLKAGQ